MRTYRTGELPDIQVIFHFFLAKIIIWKAYRQDLNNVPKPFNMNIKTRFFENLDMHQTSTVGFAVL